ncbi:MAG: hypothetical protein ABII82_12610, partial [Verrucomicrobiota bacterium]
MSRFESSRRPVTASSFSLEELEARILLSATPVEEMLKPDGGAVSSTVVYAPAAESNITGIDASDSGDGLFDFFAEESLTVTPQRLQLEGSDGVRVIDNGASLDLLEVAEGERLHGTGTYQLDLVNEGVFAPGNSPGVTEIDGNLNLTSPTSVLEIELGGENAGTGEGFHDQVQVDGNVQLGGTLDVSLFGDYTPTSDDIGRVYTILTATGSITGNFTDFEGLNIGNDVYLRPFVDGSSYKLQVMAGPARPLIFVPGFGGSFPDEAALDAWLTNLGLTPDQLQLEPVTNTYAGIINTLENVGYREGENLFIANWDWRLPLALTDGAADGVFNLAGTGAEAAALISDNTFATALDYFGFALRQASEAWAAAHDEAAPGAVDVITHSTGGIIVRAYLQSNAYGEAYADELLLPEINNFFQVAAPNQGTSQVFNFLANNFGLSENSRLIALVTAQAYDHVLNGGEITGPTGDVIDLDSISSGGVADPVAFLKAYLPSLVDLTSTQDFIDLDPADAFVATNVNSTDSASDFLLDLNAGTGIADSIGLLGGRLSVIYGDDLSTPDGVQTRTGGVGSIVDLENPLGRPVGATETWYEQLYSANGDGTVLASSAWAPFSGISALNLYQVAFSAGTESTTGHSALIYNEAVLNHILNALGFSNFASVLDTDEVHSTAEQASALVGYAFGFFLANRGSLENAVALFGTAFNAVRGYLEALDSDAVAAGFDLPSFAITIRDANFDGIVRLNNATLAVTGAGGLGNARYEAGVFTGSIVIGATSADLFAGSTFSASFVDGDDGDNNGVTGRYDFSDGEFALSFDTLAFTVAPGVSLTGTGGSFDIDPTDTDAETYTFELTGAVLTVGGATLEGDIGFYRADDGRVLLVGENLAAALTLGDFTAGFANGSLAAVITDAGRIAVTAAADNLLLSGAGLASGSADNALVSYNNTGVDFAAAPLALSVGSLSDELAAPLGTASTPYSYLSVDNAEFSLAGLLTVTADLQVTRTLTGSGDALVLVELARLAFLFPTADAANYGSVTEASGTIQITAASAISSLAVAARVFGPGGGSGLPSVFSFELGVIYDRVGDTITSTGPLGAIAAVGAAFAPALFNALAISVPGVEISGNFSVVNTLIGGVATKVIVGEDVRVFFGDRDGDDITGLELTDGEAIFVRTGGADSTVELGSVSGRTRLVGILGLDLDATLTLRISESGSAYDETFAVGESSVTLTFGADEVAASGVSFIEAVGSGIDLNVSGFAVLRGDFVFSRSGDTLVAAGTNITVFAGSGFGTEDEAGLKITGALFAVRVDLNSGNYVIAARGSVSVVGLTGASLAGTFTLISNSHATAQTLTIGAGSNLVVVDAAADSTAIAGTGTLNLAGSVVVAGDFSFGSSTAVDEWLDGLSDGLETSVIEVLPPSTGAGEEQLVTFDFSGNAYASFTLTYDGQTTAQIALALNDPIAMAAAIRTALESLSNIEEGDVEVGYAGAPNAGEVAFRVRFTGTLAGIDVPLLGVAVVDAGTYQSQVWTVDLGDQVGTFTFQLGGVGPTVDLVLNGGETESAVAAALKSALAGLAPLSADALTVVSAGAGAYTVTVGGPLAGEAVAALSVTTDAPVPTGTVVRETTGGTGVSERLVITISDRSLTATGTYTLSLGGQTSAAIRFADSDVTNNARRLREALEAFAAIGTGNVTVTFDQTSGITVQRYNVTFRAGRANTDIGEITVNDDNLRGGSVSVVTTVQGASAITEVQVVDIDAPAPGSFTLSLTVGGNTYTTAELFNDSSAAALQSALNDALGAAGSATVVSAGAGIWKVAFGGALSGSSPPLLVIDDLASTATAASVSVVTVGGSSSANIGAVTAGASTVVAAGASTGSVQEIRINASVPGIFTLSFAHAGDTYTTAILALDASAAEVQSALETALAGLAGATVSVDSPEAGIYRVAFGGTLVGEIVALLTIDAELTPPPAAYTEIIIGATNVTAFLGSGFGGASERGVKLTGGSLALRLDVTNGLYALAATGTVSIVGIADLAATGTVSLLTGTFANDVTLEIETPGGVVSAEIVAGVTEVTGSLEIDLAGFAAVSGDFIFTRGASTLDIAAAGAIAFVGSGFGTNSEVGLKLTAAAFAVSANLTTGRFAAAARGTAELVGIPGVTIAATLDLVAGTSLTDRDLTVGGDTIAYVAGTIEVSGSVELDFLGALVLSGDFTFVKIGDEITASASGVTAFAGTDFGTVDEQGLKVTDGVLALRLNLNAGTYAVAARGTAELVGLTGLALSGDLTVVASTYATEVTFPVTYEGATVNLVATAGALYLSGDISVSVADFVTISGAITLFKDADELIFAATDVSAFVGDAGVGVSLTDGLVALIYDLSTGEYAFGARGTVALTGVSGVTLAGTAEVIVNRMNADVELEVGVGEGAVALTATDGVTQVTGDLTLAVSGFVVLAGAFTVRLDTGRLEVGAAGVTTFLGIGYGTTGERGVKLTAGDLALVLDLATAEYAFAAKGSAGLVGIPNLTLSGDFAVTLSTFAADSESLELDGDTVEVLAGARDFSGTDLDLAITGLVSLSGDLAFDLSGATLVAVGENLAASLGVGGFTAGFSSGTIALRVSSNGNVALAASGSVVFTGAGFASATADSVTLRYNNTGVAVSDSITLGGITQALVVDAGTFANPFFSLAATNVAVELAGLVTLSGNFTFRRATTTDGDNVIRVGVSNLSFAFGDGTTDFLELANGNGAFLVTSAGAAGTITVTASLNGVPGIALTNTVLTFQFNTIPTAVVETVDAGGTSVSINLPAGTFLRVVGDPVNLTVAGVALQGRVAFEQSTAGGSAVTVISLADVSATLAGTIDGTDGEPVGVTDARGLFVLSDAGVAGTLSFTSATEFLSGDFVLEINNTDEAAAAEGPFGSINLEAGDYLRVVVNNLAITLPGVELTGDFYFQTVTIGGVSTQIIVGNNVTLFVGDNTGGNRIGLELTDGTAVFIRLAGDIELGYVTGRLRVVGVAGFGFDATATVRLNESDAAYSETFTLNGEDVTVDFTASEVADAGTPFVEASATNVDVNLSGFVVLRGDFIFTRTADAFVAAGTDITVFAGSGFGTASESGVKVTGGVFAVHIQLTGVDAGKYVVGVRGTGSLVGVDGVTLTGTLTVIVNQFDTDQDLELGVGGSTVSLSATASTTHITGSLTLNLAGSVVVAGDFTFQSAPAVADWIEGLAEGLQTDVTEVVPAAAGVDEEQLLTLTASTNAYGTFTLGYAGQTTVAITLALNNTAAMAAAIQAALRNLSNIGEENVTVAYAGSPSTGKHSFRIRFTGALAATDVAPLTVAVQTAGTVASQVWQVALGQEVGTFTFQLGGSGPVALLTLNGTETTSAIATALRAKLGTLAPLTASALTVTSLGSGNYRVSVGGALTGQSFGELSVTSSFASPVTSVTQTVASGSAANEVVVITLIDADLLASGTYTLTLGNKTSAPIRFADNQVEMNAARIQKALESFKAIGVGNVRVVYDQSSTITEQRYTVTFINARAGQNIADLSANDASFGNGEVLVATTKQGGPATTGSQTVSVQSAVPATFTLSLNLGGTIYTTSALSASVTAAQLQAALNNALGSAGTTTVTSSSVGIWTIAFGGALAGTSPPLLVVNTTVTADSASVSVVTAGGSQVANAAALSGVVATERQGGAAGGSIQQINVSAEAPGSMTISLLYQGTNYTTALLALDASAAQVQAAINAALIEISGATVSVTSAAAGDYRVAFGSSLAGVELALMTVEAQLTPPPVTLDQILVGATNVTAFLGTGYGTEDEVGVKLTDGSLALVLYPTTGEYALAATGTGALVGVDGVEITATLTLITGNLTVDTNLEIETPGGTVSAFIPTGITQVYGSVTVDLGGFVAVSGEFTFEKNEIENTLILGATNVTAFVGASGTGVELTDGNLAVLVDLSTGEYAFGASGTGSLTGVTGVTLTGTLEVIHSTFASGTDIELSVEVGDTTLLLTATGATSVVRGNVNVDLGGFVAASGDFEIYKDAGVLDITAANVTAFVGASGTGLQLTDGALALTVDLAAAKYAVAARGTVELTGVSGVTLTGTVTVITGTMDDDVTFSDFGGESGVDVTVTTGVSEVTGTDLLLAVGSNLILGGDFTFTKSATELVVAASGLTAFAGTGYDTDNEIGVKVTDAAFGL